MMTEIEWGNGPYALDRIAGIPALTKKNSEFIEAVVTLLDSNYAKFFDKAFGPKDPSFDPKEEGYSFANNRGGSVAYWFDQMKSGQKDYETCLFCAICTIDVMNSTHLEAAENGRLEMTQRVMEKAPTLDELKAALRDPFSSEKENHLIALLSKPMASKNKESLRCNLSFASKFCSYAAQFLEAGVEYSIYDRIVSQNLPAYLKAYGVEKKPTKRQFDATSTNDHHQKLVIYERYCDAIGKLIKAANEERINRKTLDYIIWYASK